MTEVEIFKESLDVSRIMMAITIVTAVVTVVFSALTMAFQRSHNKRTVQPYAVLSREASAGGTSLVLRNAGLGPLLLAAPTLYGPDVAAEAAAGLSRRLEACGGAWRRALRSGSLVLVPGESLVLFSLRDAVPDEVALAEALGPLGVRVGYRDLYGRTFHREVLLQDL